MHREGGGRHAAALARKVLGDDHPTTVHFRDSRDAAVGTTTTRAGGVESDDAEIAATAHATSATSVEQQQRGRVCRRLEALLAAAVQLSAPLDALLDEYISLSACIEEGGACGLPEDDAERELYSKAKARLERLIQCLTKANSLLIDR